MQVLANSIVSLAFFLQTFFFVEMVHKCKKIVVKLRSNIGLCGFLVFGLDCFHFSSRK